MSSSTTGVVYIYSDNLRIAADALPSNLGRSSLVHSLINSLDLLEVESNDSDEERPKSSERGKSKARTLEAEIATRSQLQVFHDVSFVDRLLGESTEEDQSQSDEEEEDERAPSTSTSSPTKRRKVQQEFGLTDDCPLFDGLPNYSLSVAGASIQAARELRDGKALVAISWNGGRHHARRSEASGFCYVQDIVLSILELRSTPRWKPTSSIPKPLKINKVLYLDLDLHHGDGVETAFSSTPHVLTLSIHLHSPFFFPSTGSLNSTGPTNSNSSFHALNLATHPGLSGSTLIRLYESCIVPILSIYNPDAIVVQCGCDGLSEDPCKEWNLSLEGMGEVLKRILDLEKKTLLLGGGGYNNPNAARCWSYLTAIALKREEIGIDFDISPDLPEYELFAPSFTLDVPGGNMKDQNTEQKLLEIEVAFKGYAEELKKKYCKE